MSDVFWTQAGLVILAVIAAVQMYISHRGQGIISSKVDETAAKVEEVRHSTNSLKDELVAVTRKDALAEGKLAGAAEQKENPS